MANRHVHPGSSLESKFPTEDVGKRMPVLFRPVTPRLWLGITRVRASNPGRLASTNTRPSLPSKPTSLTAIPRLFCHSRTSPSRIRSLAASRKVLSRPSWYHWTARTAAVLPVAASRTRRSFSVARNHHQAGAHLVQTGISDKWVALICPAATPSRLVLHRPVFPLVQLHVLVQIPDRRAEDLECLVHVAGVLTRCPQALTTALVTHRALAAFRHVVNVTLPQPHGESARGNRRFACLPSPTARRSSLAGEYPHCKRDRTTTRIRPW